MSNSPTPTLQMLQKRPISPGPPPTSPRVAHLLEFSFLSLSEQKVERPSEVRPAGSVETSLHWTFRVIPTLREELHLQEPWSSRCHVEQGVQRQSWRVALRTACSADQHQSRLPTPTEPWPQALCGMQDTAEAPQGWRCRVPCCSTKHRARPGVFYSMSPTSHIWNPGREASADGTFPTPLSHQVRASLSLLWGWPQGNHTKHLSLFLPSSVSPTLRPLDSFV